ncbi:MAG: glutamate mutase L [Comamonadaceae bacterium]|nr:glutamate mutase L [Comamonadaceae bacterium]
MVLLGPRRPQDRRRRADPRPDRSPSPAWPRPPPAARSSGPTPTSWPPSDLAELEAVAPDIILLTGGTDGGNARIVLPQRRPAWPALAARRPSSSTPATARSATRSRDILGGRERRRPPPTSCPRSATIDIEPAREVIRRVFLERIVDGKGLARIVAAAGREPLPTPLAVLRARPDDRRAPSRVGRTSP